MTALAAALADPDPSLRLNAVMAAGITPSPADLDVLVARCAVEPDFQVREMLTWAILRHPPAHTVPRVVAELGRPEPQARSQALHTLSKARDVTTWPAVAAHLDGDDPDVVRTAWYAAVAVVPEAERGWLASKLAAQLGRGSWETQLSLSRALIGLGEALVAPVLAEAASHADEAVRQHALATERLLDDPHAGFTDGVHWARREVGLGRTRSTKG
jgi:HEAT repeat protein